MMDNNEKFGPDEQNRESSDADIQYLRDLADKSLFDTFGIIVSNERPDNQSIHDL